MPIDMLTIFEMAMIFAILLMGSTVKGVIGMGLPLLSMPLLTFLFSPQQSITILAVPIFLSNVIQLVQGGSPFPVFKRFWPLFLMMAVGAGIGAHLLKVLDKEALAIALGVITCGFSLTMLFLPTVSIPSRLENRLNPGVGLTAGLIGGFTTFYGPVVTLYMLALNLPRDVFVRALATAFLSAVIPLNLSLAAYDFLGWEEAVTSAFTMVPVTIGLYLGKYTRQFVSPDLFRRIVLTVLFVIGITVVWAHGIN